MYMVNSAPSYGDPYNLTPPSNDGGYIGKVCGDFLGSPKICKKWEPCTILLTMF